MLMECCRAVSGDLLPKLSIGDIQGRTKKMRPLPLAIDREGTNPREGHKVQHTLYVSGVYNFYTKAMICHHFPHLDFILLTTPDEECRGCGKSGVANNNFL